VSHRIEIGSALYLDWVDAKTARRALERWYYHQSWPQGKSLNVGVWEHGRFCGVIMFGMGASDRPHGPFRSLGIERLEVCELTRMALNPTHEAPLTKMMSYALRMLARQCPGIRIVVTFADPTAGHKGTVYIAGGWLPMGRTAADSAYRDARGHVHHSRGVDRASGRAKSQQGLGAVLPGPLVRIPLAPKLKFAYPLDRSLRGPLAVLSAELAPEP
jgi:hypothetical protein